MCQAEELVEKAERRTHSSLRLGVILDGRSANPGSVSPDDVRGRRQERDDLRPETHAGEVVGVVDTLDELYIGTHTRQRLALRGRNERQTHKLKVVQGDAIGKEKGRIDQRSVLEKQWKGAGRSSSTHTLSSSVLLSSKAASNASLIRVASGLPMMAS